MREKILRWFALCNLLAMVVSGVVHANTLNRITGDEDTLVRLFPLEIEEAETTVTITVHRISGDLIPALSIAPSGGGRAIARELGNENGTLELQQVFEEAGSYDIAVTRDGGMRGTTVGDFIISIEVGSVEATQASTTILSLPFVVENKTLSLDKPLDEYQVELTQGRPVDIIVERSSGNYIPRLTVTSEISAQGVRTNGTHGTILEQFIPDKTGIYTITVAMFNPRDDTQSGDYRLAIGSN